MRHTLPVELLTKIEEDLAERKQNLRTQAPTVAGEASEKFTKLDVMRRIEEDRERVSPGRVAIL